MPFYARRQPGVLTSQRTQGELQTGKLKLSHMGLPGELFDTADYDVLGEFTYFKCMINEVIIHN